MNWWKERVGNAGFIFNLHDGESWKAEVADPVMNQEGEVQMWLSDCGDGADPCAGKHRGPQSLFVSAKRVLNLSPDQRDKPANMLLSFIHPGPHEPKDLAVLKEIEVDELMLAYHHGIPITMWD
ncbi:TPA: hypothetical protein ACH3X1_009173 [Trebouxia sp. C0004]